METATALLIEEAGYGDAPGAWLVLGGEAALPSTLVAGGHRVHWRPVLVTERDGASDGVVVSNAIDEGAYGRVLFAVPQDRDLARRWIIAAREAMAPGGDLIIAGANSVGAKSVIADAAAILGEPAASGYRQKHRIARFLLPETERPLPAWAAKEGIAPGTWQRFTVEARGERIELETQPGVFAGDRVDAGTALLLEYLQVSPGDRVLDVGCGAGVIGILAHWLGAAHADLVDTSLLAVEAAARNLERLAVPGRALASDVYDTVRGERYDLIVSNPPFHRGKAVDTSVADRLIDEAPDHLRPGGSLLIVANAFLAHGKRMAHVFNDVETVGATRQYLVLRARDPRRG